MTGPDRGLDMMNKGVDVTEESSDRFSLRFEGGITGCPDLDIEWQGP